MKSGALYFSRVEGLGKSPSRISFKEYLQEIPEWEGAIQEVRTGIRKKTSMPAIIPAGVFKGGYQVEHLRRFSGVASFDIDKIDNISEVKAQITELPWVYYLSESISGNGLWGLVRFRNPTQHVFHYSGLITEFRDMGIEVDVTSANVNRLRFYSYDPGHYLNESAEVFKRMEMKLRTEDGISIDWSVQYDYAFNARDRWMIRRFNEEYECEALFEEAGWEVTGHTSRGQVDVLRPGSDKSRSGNILDNKFWCFTDSTNFRSNTLNTAFDCYNFLFHKGKVKQALRGVKGML